MLVTYIADLIASMLDLPEAVADVSPFRHVAAVPAEPIDVGAAAAMVTIGIAGVVVDAVAYRRRDLQEV